MYVQNVHLRVSHVFLSYPPPFFPVRSQVVLGPPIITFNVTFSITPLLDGKVDMPTRHNGRRTWFYHAYDDTECNIWFMTHAPTSCSTVLQQMSSWLLLHRVWCGFPHVLDRINCFAAIIFAKITSEFASCGCHCPQGRHPALIVRDLCAWESDRGLFNGYLRLHLFCLHHRCCAWGLSLWNQVHCAELPGTAACQ